VEDPQEVIWMVLTVLLCAVLLIVAELYLVSRPAAGDIIQNLHHEDRPSVLSSS
jgi:membrane protein implicated in regulation of membrane protease activity